MEVAIVPAPGNIPCSSLFSGVERFSPGNFQFRIIRVQPDDDLYRQHGMNTK